METKERNDQPMPSRTYSNVASQPPASRIAPTISVPFRGISRSLPSELSPVDAPDDRSVTPQPPDRNMRGERSQPRLKRADPSSRGKAPSGSRSEGETVASPSDVAPPDSDSAMNEASDDDFQLVSKPLPRPAGRGHRHPPPPSGAAPSQSHLSSGPTPESSAVDKSLPLPPPPPPPPPPRSRSSSVSSTRAEDGKRPVASHDQAAPAADSSSNAASEEPPEQDTAPTSLLGIIGTFLAGPRQTEEERLQEIRRAEEVEEERRTRRQQRRTLENWHSLLDQYGEYSIAHQWLAMRKEIGEVKMAYNNLLRRVQHGEQRETDLSMALELAENTVKDLQVELGTSRAFVEADDRGDTSSLITQLARISSGIDDTAFNIAGKILGEHSEAPFTEEMARTLDEMNVWTEYGEDERTVMRNLAKYSVESGSTVEGYAIGACATVLSMGIQQRVFDMFRAGLPQEDNDFALKLYQRIRAEEPQDRAARWRSISFTRALSSSRETDDAIASAIASDLLKSLSFLLSPFLLASPADPSATGTPSETPLERLAAFRAEVTKLVLQAVQWQARTRRDFLSYDYETTADLATAGEQREKVIGVVGFGLAQVKGVAKDKPARVELVGHGLAEVPLAFSEI